MKYVALFYFALINVIRKINKPSDFLGYSISITFC